MCDGGTIDKLTASGDLFGVLCSVFFCFWWEKGDDVTDGGGAGGR